MEACTVNKLNWKNCLCLILKSFDLGEIPTQSFLARKQRNMRFHCWRRGKTRFTNGCCSEAEGTASSGTGASRPLLVSGVCMVHTCFIYFRIRSFFHPFAQCLRLDGHVLNLTHLRWGFITMHDMNKLYYTDRYPRDADFKASTF